ncbi:MAG: serine protease [Pseudomonadota bacterium]|nr:serine protease [Pseudomonadota bacterium]
MRPVDIGALLILFGVLATSLLGAFGGEKDVQRGPGEKRRPMPTGPALPDPSPRDPVIQIQGGGPKKNSIGTAFSLDSDGIWMTARHVVDGCTTVGIERRSGEAVRVRKIWIHPDADLAILSDTLRTPALEIAERLPTVGETGFGVGYPQGIPAEVTGTLIGRAVSVALHRNERAEPVLTWAESRRYPDFEGTLGGISGGPLFVSEGRVAGVVISGSPRRGRFNTAAPRSFPAAIAAAQLTPDRRDRYFTFPDYIDETSIDGLGDTLRSAGAVALVYCLVE